MNTDDERWRILQTAVYERQLKDSFVFFRRENIEPILIKGWAAVRFYPDEDKRFPGDIDLCIDPAVYLKAFDLLKTSSEKMPIDLHNGFRRLDTLSFSELYSRSKLMPVGETDVRVLSDEDHLRVLCVHWLNDGGAYREKLKDIHYAVENRRPDFDWDGCLLAAGEKRRRWIACAVLLAHKYFGTRIDDTPLREEKELPAWLVRTVEREWADPVRLTPLRLVLNDRKELWQQLKKRFPPNALQATIEMEGDLDRRPRAWYQIVNTAVRIVRSIRR